MTAMRCLYSLMVVCLLAGYVLCGEKYIAIPMSDIELVPVNHQQQSSTTLKSVSSSPKNPRGFSRNFYDMGAHTGPNGEYAWHWQTYRAKPRSES